MTDPNHRYRPSNGTEGMSFMAEWCDRCAIRGICRIISKTMIYNRDDPEYPEQWTYDAEGYPICTSFADSTWPKHRKPCSKTSDLFAEQLP